jgi:hypothetical protein
MSEISVDSAAPVIPERRRHSALEVINVDDFDDDVLILESPRPSQRRRLDSHPSLDAGVIRLDDDDVVEVPVASGSGRRSVPRRPGKPDSNNNFTCEEIYDMSDSWSDIFTTPTTHAK